MGESPVFRPERLERFIVSALSALGIPESDAQICAARLIEADLRGVETHGIFRLPQYCQRIRAGGLNLRPKLHLGRENLVTALVDGDNGLGQVVVTFASDLAIAKAAEAGMAWVGTFNGNHAGAAATYTTRALAHDMICMYMTVANGNHMPPWGGVEAILGTNPISIAIPAGQEPPVVLDIATTVTAHGKVKLAAQRGETMPIGWMMDRKGQPLTDPKRAAEGFLMPIGGYTGYGLTVGIGMLAGVLNGAAFGRSVVDFNKDFVSRNNSGHMILAIRVDNFQPADTFKKEMDRAIREIRESEKMEGVDRIWLPGEIEHYKVQERRAAGIPLAASVVESLRALAKDLNLGDRLE